MTYHVRNKLSGERSSVTATSADHAWGLLLSRHGSEGVRNHEITGYTEFGRLIWGTAK